MKSVSLNAFPRTLGRRAGAKKLRANGRIPAIIYGRQAQPQNLEVSAKEMEDLIHRSISENLLVDLAVSEDARPKRLALVQEVQHHALSGKVLHVDFHEIAETEKVTVSVPVETIGEAEGVKTQGGVLEHVLFKVKARGLAKDLPEVLTVDVSHLKIGEAVHLGEIKAPPGVELVGDKQIPVIAVAAPRTEEEEAAEAAEAAAATAGEVEMIKEKKEEGEEGAPPAKGAEKGAEKAGAKGAAEKGAPGAADKKAVPGAADKKAPAAADKKAAPAEKKK
jgi:large subunit ribosomal protein L25